MDTLYWKYLLVRTPLEGLVSPLRRLRGLWHAYRQPALRDIYLEGERIERVMSGVITHRSNCIDVGAHIGSALSRIVALAPGGRHFAFEPLPHKAAWLRRKFPEVDVRAVALGNVDGRVSFFDNRSRPGFSGLRAAGGPQDCVQEVTVECARLDTIIGPGHVVDFFKLDVEGAELPVLQGAAELLRRDGPTILFESAPGGAERFGFVRGDLFSFLVSDHAYDVFFLKDFLAQGNPMDGAAFEQGHQYPFKAFNYLAVKRRNRRPSRCKGEGRVTVP
jgi:FkbM family methyltransferase